MRVSLSVLFVHFVVKGREGAVPLPALGGGAPRPMSFVTFVSLVDPRRAVAAAGGVGPPGSPFFVTFVLFVVQSVSVLCRGASACPT
jgi:hypothetical protein